SMQTRFGRLLESRYSYGLFLLLEIAMAVFAGSMTNRALSLTLNTPIHGCILLFMCMGVVVLTESEGRIPRKGHLAFRRFISLYSCWFLYYVFILLPVGLVLALAQPNGQLWAAAVHAAGISALVLVGIGFARTHRLKVQHYSVRLRARGQEYRIALLSDLHLGIFVGAQHMNMVVEKLNALQADLVLIAGDIIDSDHEILEDQDRARAIAQILRTIQAKDGVWAVLGNHDPEFAEERFQLFLKEAGIGLLYNDEIELEKINLVGRAGICHMKEIRIPLDRILSHTNPSKPVVVLDHDPQGIREAMAQHVDLVLCGHTHRGQFFPMTYLTKLANGKEYFYGYQKHGQTHSVISAGTGYFRLPMRLGTDNEIVDLHLLL
ncbi:MAG: metallophosphoesterase, partial [Candidatus Faecivicinus sp.]